MTLHHDALERRTAAGASVRNHLRRTGHSIEFCHEERLELVSGRIRHWIKKAFHCFDLGKAERKLQREFNVELHGDDDRELMARYNARREESGLAEYDRSVSRLREAVH